MVICAGPIMKILQINSNRSKQAHDMALSTATNLQVDCLMISEPNISSIRNRSDWIYDDSFKSALKILNCDIRIKTHGYGKGFSYIVTTKGTLFSCYSSGNADIGDLEETLNEIEQHLRANSAEVVITGDFNAKSPQWGMNQTDRRGQIITEWIASNDLVVINQGSKPTFVHQNYGSILDLTLATVNIARNIKNWNVLEMETLSDHNYIMFDVLEEKQTGGTKSITQGWQIKKLDHRRLQEEVETLGEIQDYMELKTKLKTICDSVMPRKQMIKGRRRVYWWNEEISQLRNECLRKRREYTRKARRGPIAENIILWENYKESKKTLRNSIKKAKRDCWKSLLGNIDDDIWGDGYKIVMKGMLGFPPRLNLTSDVLENAIKYLFPVHEGVIFKCDKQTRFQDFSVEEICNACGKMKNNKAPGPSNIPAEIIKAIVKQKANCLLPVYNKLAKEATFPVEWKVAKLVLLRKGNKPLENPSSFRPICVLDAESKLYEHLLLERLTSELERTGGLSNNQFGFRKGLQTIDAINEIVNMARRAAEQRELCVAITLDVQNAFNSASWQRILQNLRKRGIDESLISIIFSYLSQRTILVETENGIKQKTINSGVPQGSVIGPTLWNILYDDVLASEMPIGVRLIGFADDLALTASAKSETLLSNLVNRGLHRVSQTIENLKLKLAPEKTEAVLLTKRRKLAPMTFILQGKTIILSQSIKYLGVWLDTKLTFCEHVKQAVMKAEKTISALTKLLPNIGGPRSSKRKVLSSVAHSQILYAAPVWHTVIHNKKLLQKLTGTQRKMNLRICSAYRTVSAEAACVITGVPPIEIQVIERRERYTGVRKEEAKENTFRTWQQKWDNGVYGRWTYRLIPNIQAWTNRPYGEVDYFLTQALTGHGCFRRYLYNRGRSETFRCSYCNNDDEVEHTLFQCPNWSDARAIYEAESGRIFNESNMMESLLHNEASWKCAYRTIRKIIETKEQESRRP